LDQIMKPRSPALVLIAFAVVALVCARLGIWQLHRLEERRALNRAALAQRSEPPLELKLDDTMPSVPANRRVRASGHYDGSREIVLRGRVYQGVPGVELVTPLVGDSGTSAVLVNRGFVPAPDAATVDRAAYAPVGPARVEGIALPISSGGGAPIGLGTRGTWAKLDRDLLRAQFPYRISPFYILQTSEQPAGGFPRRLDAPALDDGPHLSYAIQWFAFSAMAVIFGIVIARQSARRPVARSSW
jgi:surfeit locus 1 family protein